MQALYQWDMTDGDAAQVLRDLPPDADAGVAAMRHCRRLVKGVIAERDDLDQRLSEVLDRDLSQVDTIERALLRLGLWELDAGEPPRSVISGAVEMAGVFGATDSFKYINAVLDKLAAARRD